LNRGVLDASAAIGLLVESQSTLAVAAMRGQGQVFVAPSVCSLGVRHAILRPERRAILAVAAVDSDMPVPETAEVRGAFEPSHAAPRLEPTTLPISSLLCAR